MSLYGDAIAAIKLIILIEERVQRVVGRVDRLGDEVQFASDRLARLENLVEAVRTGGAPPRPTRGEPDEDDDEG